MDVRLERDGTKSRATKDIRKARDVDFTVYNEIAKAKTLRVSLTQTARVKSFFSEFGGLGEL